MIYLVIFLASIILLTGLLNDIKIVIDSNPILSIIITTVLRISAALVIVMGGFIIIGVLVLLCGNKSKD